MTTKSEVYKDDDGFVVLVSHGKSNPLVRLGVELTGLLHYCLREEDGKLEIFDGTNDVFYTVDGRWVGLAEDAVSLLEAAAHWNHGSKVDDRYFKTIELYEEAQKNVLVREALS